MRRQMLLRVVHIFRDLWLMLGITLILLGGLEVVARLAFELRNNSDNDQLINLGLRADVYRNQQWAAEYWREYSLTQFWYTDWHSYVYWRRKPYGGMYIHINQEGIRDTWNPTPSPSPNGIKIMMFGGSALWGTGARDEFTIPSLVSKQLSARNVDAWVTNLGQDGYVNTQEMIALMLELRKGNVPDLVVFYDGANDPFSAFQQGVVGIPQNEYNRRAEFNQLNWQGGLIERLRLYWAVQKSVQYAQSVLGPGQASVAQPGQPRELANKVLDTYIANMQIVESLAQNYGFTAIFYWQPVIYNKTNLSPFEKTQVIRSNEAAFFQQMDQVLKQRALSQTHSNFHDLSNIFNAQPETVFIDFLHISEAGNDRIADSIVRTLMPLASHARTRLLSNH